MAKADELPAIAAGVLRDIAGLSGAGSIAWGCFLIHPALGYIVTGMMLLAAAIASAVRGVVAAVKRAPG